MCLPGFEGDDADTQAFVAMLYGSRTEFLVCALLLGHCLQRYCPGFPRVLLVSRKSSFASCTARKALKIFWKIWYVKPIRLPSATRARRHELIFTKLHAFCVHARHVLFLDLDLLVRSGRIAELFQVEAPAGMYHGCASKFSGATLEHGKVIDSSAFNIGIDGRANACVNAGVLRLDTAKARPERKKTMATLEAKAAQIQAADATMLPEQYFLVQELSGPWRHLAPTWNWEVGPEVEIKDGWIYVHDSGDWANTDLRHAVVFHFSGRECLPWQYLDLTPEEAKAEIHRRYGWRDGSSRISQAVTEWCTAVRDLMSHAECNSRVVAWDVKMRRRRASWRAVFRMLKQSIEELSVVAPEQRRPHFTACARCLRENVETFSWCGMGWYCAQCVLRDCDRELDTPRSAERLVGRWLDIGPTETIACITADLRVQFDGWGGVLELGTHGEVHIKWDDANWYSSGQIYGHIIAWGNGAEWAHIIGTWP